MFQEMVWRDSLAGRSQGTHGAALGQDCSDGCPKWGVRADPPGAGRGIGYREISACLPRKTMPSCVRSRPVTKCRCAADLRFALLRLLPKTNNGPAMGGEMVLSDVNAPARARQMP